MELLVLSIFVRILAFLQFANAKMDFELKSRGEVTFREYEILNLCIMLIEYKTILVDQEDRV